MKDVCNQFGNVEAVSLKKKLEQGKERSLGVAIVQYSDVAGAKAALQKLPFAEGLGDPRDLMVELYKSWESRKMEELEQQQKSEWIKEFYNGDAEESQNALAEPLLQALATLQGLHAAQQEEDLAERSPPGSLLEGVQPPVSVEEFECPAYLIRPVRQAMQQQAAQMVPTLQARHGPRNPMRVPAK